MTTYSYYLTLNDTEIIMLRKSLNSTIEHCAHKIENGDDVPYRAHKQSAEEVLSRLYANTRQTSGNNFSDGGNEIWISDPGKKE
jgi:hypothetical protein